MFLDKELAFAEHIIRHAGALALGMRDQLSITHKPLGLGPVTNADLAIDRYLTEAIAHAFADDLIVSEEGINPPEVNGRVWFVDPIDGTASYMVGKDDFSIMIGLAIDGVAHMGMVFQPVGNILWRGCIDPRGQETFADVTTLHARRTLCIEPSRVPAQLTLIASRLRKSARQTEMIRRLSPTNIVYKSSIGLKAMVIAEGDADFYVAWSNHIALWDTCAPAAILAAAGGHVSFVDGQPLTFSGAINHHQPVLLSGFQPGRAFFDELADIAQR